MIYTIGFRESYKKLFGAHTTPQKSGRDVGGGYLGGWVWATREEAQSQCTPGYKVYGINADWEKDTTPGDDTTMPGMHYLLVTSDLVDLINQD